MTEISSVVKDLPVYTRNGTYVGQVRNAILDLERRMVEALLVTDTNDQLVEGSQDVAVPFRWVSDFDDILVLRYFPEEVSEASDTEEAPEADNSEFIEVTA